MVTKQNNKSEETNKQETKSGCLIAKNSNSSPALRKENEIENNSNKPVIQKDITNEIEINIPELYKEFCNENANQLGLWDWEQERNAFAIYCYISGINNKQKDVLRIIENKLKSTKSKWLKLSKEHCKKYNAPKGFVDEREHICGEKLCAIEGERMALQELEDKLKGLKPKFKCDNCNEEPVEHKGDFCENCNLPERSAIK